MKELKEWQQGVQYSLMSLRERNVIDQLLEAKEKVEELEGVILSIMNDGTDTEVIQKEEINQMRSALRSIRKALEGSNPTARVEILEILGGLGEQRQISEQ